MKEADWTKVRRDKDASRERNANGSYAEKLDTLDRLRDRARAMKGDTTDRGPGVVRGAKTPAAQRKK